MRKGPDFPGLYAFTARLDASQPADFLNNRSEAVHFYPNVAKDRRESYVSRKHRLFNTR
jgi:hypothetical protein